MVRADGIEPSTPAWKAGVLPLNYARLKGIEIKPKYDHSVKGNSVIYLSNPRAWLTIL
jgi:hypothetical protein